MSKILMGITALLAFAGISLIFVGFMQVFWVALSGAPSPGPPPPAMWMGLMLIYCAGPVFGLKLLVDWLTK